MICAATNWLDWARHLPPPAELARRDLGRAIVEHRSSFVRRYDTGRGTVFVKTYEYTTWRARLANLAKWTAPWRRSRARAEFVALQWLRQRGFAAPAPVAVLEQRRLGFLVRATLLTEAFPGCAADQALRAARPAERAAIVAAIRELVQRLHAEGFRDRNLDLRNLLVAHDERGVTVAKIDSPRHRLRHPGRVDDALARADWARLEPQLAEFELDAGR